MNKKKIITTASAVALAAMLAFGGTLAYYQGQAETPVENTLVDQGNSVTISETGKDGNTTYGNTYSIIPGTTDKKDPVVTAEFTLDSYVYVTVDDTTEGWIEWEAASAWTKLDGYDNVYYLLLKTAPLYSDWDDDSSYTDTDTGYAYTYTDSETYAVKDSSGNILYTYTAEAAGSTTLYTASISVIDGDTIAYSSGITNETFEGYGSTVSLNFTAYIIQAWLEGSDSYGESSDNYATAAEAYAVALGAPYVSGASYTFLTADEETTVAQALATAISSSSADETTVIVLPEADDDTEAVSLSSYISVSGGKDIVIDLNGNTLSGGSSSRSVQVTGGAELTLVDGEIENESGYGVMAFNRSTVTLDDVEVTASSVAVVADNSEIIAEGATITSTGNAAIQTQNGNNTLTLTDCTIISKTYLGILDQGANNKITVEGCTITSAYFGVYHNGSTSPVTIILKDSTITDSAYTGVYVSNSSTAGREKQTLVIDNCTITGPTAVEFKHTNATITNSTLIATATPTASYEFGNGACCSGYSLACTTNSATDYVTGNVVVSGCTFQVDNNGNTSEGYVFVFNVAEGYSVTIDGKTVSNYNTYGGESNTGILTASLDVDNSVSDGAEVTASVTAAD